MQELIGQIAATIIAGTIILILAVIAWRGQRATIDATQYEAAKQGTVNLARVLELDLSNMGAGLDNNNVALNGAVIDFDTTATTRTFEFWTQTDTSQATAGDTVRVRYDWEEQSTVTVRRPNNTFVTKPAYAVKRFVNTGGGYTLDGQSSDVLTAFAFHFRNAAGSSIAPASSPASSAAVREIEVRVRAVSPLGGGTAPLGEDNTQFIDQTRWSRVFRPVNLTRVQI